MSESNGLNIEWKPAGRNGAVQLTARLGAEVMALERIDLAKPKARAAFAKGLHAKVPSATLDDIESKLLAIAGERTRPVDAQGPKQHTSPAPVELLDSMPPAVRAEARAMLDAPELLERILADIESLGVSGERELALTLYLVGTSRLLPRPLAAIITGHTSSGKSFIPERVADLFPPEAVLRATQQTPQSLFYLEPGSLMNRFVVAGERSRADSDDAAEATRALREMLASGRLSKLVVMKAGDKMKSVLVEQEGPIAYVESTTAGKIFDEDANRCLLLATDERKEQTRRIVESLGARAAGETNSGGWANVVARHHAAQRMLARFPVVIPFGNQLAKAFDSDRVEARRAFPMLVGMIEASALLHQFQRQQDGEGRLLASPDDYKLARHLLSKPFTRQLGGGVSDSAGRLYQRLEQFGDREFTTSESAETCRNEVNPRSVRNWLSELTEAGCLEQTEPPRGNKPAKWRMTGRTPDEGTACPALPAPEKVFS